MGVEQQFQAAQQLHSAGRLDEAERAYREVLGIEPKHADALHLLGVIAHQRGQSNEAAKLIESAIAIGPNIARFHSNLGEVHRATGELDLAVASFRQALKLDERLPETHGNLALALKSLGRFDEAVASCRRALELRPNYSKVLNTLALLLRGDGRLAEAEQALRAAFQQSPGDVQTVCNYANLLFLEGFVPQAAELYGRLLAAAPSDAEVMSNLIFTTQFDPNADADAIATAHKSWGAKHADALTAQSPPVAPRDVASKRQLRVGYVSPDLCYHPVGRFVLPALLGRDRSRFHVTCYSDSPESDELTARFRAATDGWHDTRRMNDEHLAQQIRADEIDILIDLAGHTAGNRLLCFARRPAPVQATYLGYPDTTGMAAMDFRLTDAIADPPGTTERLHTELLIHLAGCAWCISNFPDAPVSQARPNREIRFGSFNHAAKVNEKVVKIWGDVLRAVPGSTLAIKAAGLSSPAAQERLRHLFAANGIETGRVQLLPPTRSSSDHLASYSQIDVALDTFPYNGTTTTCEALWMGVPVVTLAGKRHASRVGASLLTAAGHPDWIAESPEQYIQIAARLARELSRPSDLRASLKRSELCNAQSYSRNFDRALEAMWADYVSRVIPQTPRAPEC